MDPIKLVPLLPLLLLPVFLVVAAGYRIPREQDSPVVETPLQAHGTGADEMAPAEAEAEAAAREVVGS